jgi:hypothetical protein
VGEVRTLLVDVLIGAAVPVSVCGAVPGWSACRVVLACRYAV